VEQSDVDTVGGVAFEAGDELSCAVAYTVSETTTTTMEGYSEVGIDKGRVTAVELDSGE
jgi:hypothetical protein